MLKAKIHYSSFPVASPQQVRNINEKSVGYQISNKLARANARCACCVVRVVSQIPLQRLVTKLLRGLDADLLAVSITSTQ